MEFETREHLYQLEQIIVEQESELKEVRKNLRQLQQLHDSLEQQFAELKQQVSENTTSLIIIETITRSRADKHHDK